MRILTVAEAEFGDTAARVVIQEIDRIERPVIGLPTGRTMTPLYESLNRAGLRLPPGTRCFAIDEYCWSDATHPGTNASFFRQYCPPASGWPEVIVPRADAADPATEIAHHCATIEQAGGLDLVILGIGRDGHIAFNEPGSGPEAGCRVVTLSAATRDQVRGEWEEPPTIAMTVGMQELLAARYVFLLARGEEKREVLATGLHDPPGAALPASFLQAHPRLTVISDVAALPRALPDTQRG